MTSPDNRSASWMARLDFPVAVGPIRHKIGIDAFGVFESNEMSERGGVLSVVTGVITPKNNCDILRL